MDSIAISGHDPRVSHAPSIRPIAPKGDGTGDIESLTGLLTRIAHRQQMGPRVLARRVTEIFSTQAHGKSATQGAAAHTINGAGQSALRTARALDAGVSKEGHARLTLNAWSPLFGREPNYLLRTQLAWCPECWASDAETPYHRLLWTLKGVQACPHHGVYLKTSCDACGQVQAAFPARPFVSVCRCCEASLISREHNARRLPHPDDRELWIAAGIQQLIARTCAVGRDLEIEHFRRWVEVVADQLVSRGFNPSATLGVAPDVMRKWKNGAFRPSPPSVWEISYRTYVPIDHMLLDSYPLLESLPIRPQPRPGLYERQALTESQLQRLERKIERVLSIPLSGVPSAARLAAEANVRPMSFKYHYPEEYERVVQRFRKRRRLEAAARKARRVRHIVAACAELREQELYPSDRNLREVAGCCPGDLRRREVQLYLRRYRQQMMREAPLERRPPRSKTGLPPD